MWISQFLLCVSLICVSSAYKEKCQDCKLYRSCPEAVHYANVTTNFQIRDNKLKSSFCGTEMVNGKKLPKVCCSDFRTTDDRTAFFEDAGSKDDIEGHKNIGLLPKECGNINGERVYGGSVANLYEFPWMALISQKSRIRTGDGNDQIFKCGGTIINSRYILTAAHCVVNKKLYKVRIGELNLDSKEDCQGEYPNNFCEGNIQDIPIKDIIPHEDYRRSPSINDIALIRLVKPIDFSHKNAAPICLPVVKELRNATLGGRIATVAGWGATETSPKSSILLKVDVPILTPLSCREKKPETTPLQLCAGETGKDSCNGDSGGPLMVENEIEGKYKIVQYGIVSYGPLYCGTAIPGVYTDVTRYMDWILDHIES